MSEIYTLRQGDGPLLVSVPHAGTDVPGEISGRFSEPASGLPDTDWWIDRVWRDGASLGAGMLVASMSRFVVDLNRPQDDEPLYRGAGTGLVPTETFDGESIYRDGEVPGIQETQAHVQRYWQPYHAALAAELERIRQLHGYALLLDAHSIRSRVPRLFTGRLPDLNLGSNGGVSASPGLVRRARAQLETWPGCTSVLDGRFRGGHITRHYGRPAQGIHALQLEMAQSVYMQERPPRVLEHRLTQSRALATAFVQCLISWEPGDD